MVQVLGPTCKVLSRVVGGRFIVKTCKQSPVKNQKSANCRKTRRQVAEELESEVSETTELVLDDLYSCTDSAKMPRVTP
jgi:hypothetical protein